ncbi:MAG: FmdE family protein [Thermodesulfovibrionales bacterium]|nr:FmdE family protein [Thermodesulfovibrionales bacterium]
MLNSFDDYLKESVRLHGHLCPGQVLGVKMAMLGLKLIGINDPKGIDRKNLIVFVEMDRCATDAIQSVTGCSLGRRTLKYIDYGKMAATFVNLKNNHAVRIIAKEEARGWAEKKMPEIEDKYKAQLQAYIEMSDEELFDTMPVKVDIKPQDMPGRPLRRVLCDSCGEAIQDMREVAIDDKIMCKYCAEGGGYYTML